jgi:FlgD Ig-like domain
LTTGDTRLLAPLLFALIVLATLAGFLVVERERKHPTLVIDDRATHRFEPGAPNGSGVRRRATFAFEATHPDGNASVTVVSSSGETVRTLDQTSFADDSEHRYTWNGRTESGELAPPGVYVFHVDFGDLGHDLPVKETHLVATPDGG